MNQFETVIFEKNGAVAVVTINRPKSMNALNSKVIEELSYVLNILENDSSTRVVIFTGSGKAFVAGADIAEMQFLHPGAARDLAIKGSKMMERIEFLEQVTIASVNGYALGGGCELALSCDIIVSSDKAVFGQPEVGLGITPGFSGTQRLPRAVGQAKAKEMILTGDSIDAREAERIGLVNKVVPHEELMEETYRLVNRILKNAPSAVRYANVAIQRGSEKDIDTGITIESAMFDLCFVTDDRREGMAAFLEKRKAEFKDQ